MKTKSVMALVTLTAISFEVKAQSPSDITQLKGSGYWNLSYSIGIGKDLKSNGYVETPSNGFTFSLDASFTPEKNIGFFANYSSTDLYGTIFSNDNFGQYRDRYFGGAHEQKYNFLGISVGPRLFFNDKIFFIDAGLGYYNVAEKKFIGLNAGAGAKIKFSDSYGLLINGRIHNTFVQRHAGTEKEAFVYYGIYLGLELNNNKDKQVVGNKKNKFAVAALGGSYSSALNFTTAGTSFGAELSYDISPKISFLFDYFHSKSDMTFRYSNGADLFVDKQNNTGNDFSAGLRLYLMGNNLRVFVENSANIYFFERSSELSNIQYYSKSSTVNNYFGLNFGAGVDCKLVENLSGIFKMNLGTYVAEGYYYSGIYGGLKYGF